MAADKTIRSYIQMTLGSALLAFGVYFFKFPNHFTTGGVSGLAILIGRLVPSISPAQILNGLNIALLLLGFVVLGRGFGLRTVYCSLLYSAITWVLEVLVPLEAPLTTQPLLELIFSILLPGLASALLFRAGASSGGTDITAMILKKYTNIQTGRALLYVDVIIAASSLWVFDIETGLFSLLGLFSKAFVIDTLLESFDLCKYFTIVTTKPEAICQFIIHELHHTATCVDATGAYSHRTEKLVLTACRRSEAIRLQREVRAQDAEAFMFIANTSEIIGKGFRTA